MIGAGFPVPFPTGAPGKYVGEHGDIVGWIIAAAFVLFWIGAWWWEWKHPHKPPGDKPWRWWDDGGWYDPPPDVPSGPGGLGKPKEREKVGVR